MSAEIQSGKPERKRAVSPVIPKPGPAPADVKVRVHGEMLKKIDRVRELENQDRPEGDKLSRNDVMLHLLASGLENWQKETKTKL